MRIPLLVKPKYTITQRTLLLMKWLKLYNVFQAYLDLILLRKKPRAYPIELSLGTSSFCNLKCIQCPREGHDGNRTPFDERLDPAYFQSLEPFLKRAVDVSLYGLGEPMIDKHYFETVRYVTSHGGRVSLSSNGTLLDETRCRETIESGIKSIGISLDAATTETFDIVRPPGGFEKIVENIERLTRMKNKMFSPRPHLMLSFGVMPHNLNDLPNFPALAAKVGAQEIIAHPVIYMSEAKKRELELNRETLFAAVEEARQRAKDFNIPFTFWDLDPMSYLKSLEYVRSQKEAEPAHLHLSKKKPSHFCFFLWRNAMIQGRGELFPCCYMTNVKVGELDGGTLDRLRDGEFVAALRRQIYDGNPPAPCMSCPQLHPYSRKILIKSALQEIRNLLRG